MYVALDLETTGFDPQRDAIIEVGAVKFRAGEVVETFSTFISPGRPIPFPVTELTGIRDQDLVGAPPLHEVLPRLARFVGQAPLVGHSVGFDLAFLRRHSAAFENVCLDTFELAGVLLPRAERYSLEALAHRMGIPVGQSHRALDDALTTCRLYTALFGRAAALPIPLLKEIVRHAERGQWPAAIFFRAALEEAHAREGANGRPAPSRPATRATPPPPPLRPAAERQPLDIAQLAALLEEGGPFAAHFPGYEYRPQQAAMLRAVAQAFNQSGHLLVEAPTGVGKSLAYLAPAVFWAKQNGERVVVSTNTINLQEQLYRKDVPDLQKVLPFEFSAALLKGRSHYICPARLQAARRQGANSPEKARVLAKILVWLPETTDGDGDELFLPDPTERAIWRHLSADQGGSSGGCEPERCVYFRDGLCYFYRARRAAEAAHLVIVNHALLLADVTVQNHALPDYRYLIVDEAHHLESATTEGLSFETDRHHLQRMLADVGSLSPAGQVSGLLGEVLGSCRRARPANEAAQEMLQRLELLIGKIGLLVERAAAPLAVFFDCLEEFAAEHEQGQREGYALRLRITPGVRIQPAWDAVEIAWDAVSAPLESSVKGLEKLAGALEECDYLAIPDSEELQAQLLGFARQIGEVTDRLNRLIAQPDSSAIYWLESDNHAGRLRLHAAPLHIGPLVEEHLFHKKESVVLTSATLRVGGSFDFLRERLNAWDADELAVGSPFDYRNSTLVYLVDDIPEPNAPGYQHAVEQGMIALFRATQGRALGLFTSYNQLQTTLRAIQAPLAQAGITVQAQGQGVSRGQLLEDFRTGERRVLLGTRSFWEGIDVPGEALSCLAIARLPFSVPGDPIFAARAETFDEPFLDYAVPETILRFLQGFGRLIRTRTDRGVVAVFDKRLLTKSYGSAFIESLPEPTVRQGALALLPRAAAEWLG